ncbi:putative aspartic-type endopeptidase opsB [Rhypophila decipiens]
MRTTTTILAVAAAILPTVTEGLVLQQKQPEQQGQDGRPAPKVVGMPIERRRPTRDPIHRDKLRKRGTLAAALDNEETLYFINATIGTPGKSVRLHIDTGSSDLWVNTPSSQLCTESSQPCKYAGTYMANSSSTYEYIGSWFNISYVDGSGASGDYVSDTITIGGRSGTSNNGGVKLERLQFGIGYSSTNSQGILGIGYPINEVQVGRAGMKPYKNLPAQMVADGVIQSSAYSLWLNDLDADTGEILFGGVDQEKYTGSLQTLPIQSSGSGIFAEFLITLTSLKLGDTVIKPASSSSSSDSSESNDNLALAVLLDTGSSLTYLPDAMVSQIYTLVNAQYDSSAGAAYVPCSLATSTPQQLEFTFSGPTIKVDMNELVLDLVTSSGNRPTFQNGVPACLFGIAPAGSGTNVLGDTFLRSAYVVYDMDNNQISLAQTKFNTTASRVVEIGKGEGAVPDATMVANPVAATEGISGGGGGGGGGSGGGGGGPFGGLGGSDSAASGIGMMGGSLMVSLVLGFVVFWSLF